MQKVNIQNVVFFIDNFQSVKMYTNTHKEFKLFYKSGAPLESLWKLLAISS